MGNETKETLSSLLYSGFRFASLLPSIIAQRTIQREILLQLSIGRNVSSIFSVGCAFGDELNELLMGLPELDRSVTVSAIDLADTEEQIRQLEFVYALGGRFHLQQLDLLSADTLPGFGTFDIVQCSFVLHDIDWSNKTKAYRLLADAVRPGGFLLLSDIFPACSYLTENSNVEIYRYEINSIYESFIIEANKALDSGILNPDQWRLLVGSNDGPGLIATRQAAMEGLRDYFQTLSQTVEHVVEAGFIVERILPNPVNSRLAVILAKRPHSPSIMLSQFAS